MVRRSNGTTPSSAPIESPSSTELPLGARRSAPMITLASHPLSGQSDRVFRRAASIFVLVSLALVTGCGSGATTAKSLGSKTAATTSAEPSTETTATGRTSTSGPSESTSTTATVPLTSAVEANAKVCSGGDLKSVADPHYDGAMGNVKLIVRLTNASDAPCWMPASSPTLSGIRGDGTVVAFNAPGGGTYFGNPSPFTGPLRPGAQAAVWINGGEASSCVTDGSSQTWKAMLLGLPDGSTVEFTTGFDTICGISGISLFGVDDSQPGATDNTDGSCGTVVPSTINPSEGLTTFMTLVPGTTSLDYTFAARPLTVCPGDTVHITVGIHNSGQNQAEVGSRLVITDVLPHIDLGSFGPVTVPPGEDRTVQVDLIIPLLPPGDYRLFVADDTAFHHAVITVKAAPST